MPGLDLEFADGSFALRACVFDLVDPLLDAVTAIYMLTRIKASLIILLYGLKADRACDRLFLLIQVLHKLVVAMDRSPKIDPLHLRA